MKLDFFYLLQTQVMLQLVIVKNQINFNKSELEIL